MPYSSDAQRKFFHTDTAKAAGITGDEVKEFDKASKGKELPEHVKKMDEGGIAEPDDKKFATEVGQGINEGINHDSDAVKSYLSSKFAQLVHPTTEEPKATLEETFEKDKEGMHQPSIDPILAATQLMNGPLHAAKEIGMHYGIHRAGHAMKDEPEKMDGGGYPHVTFMEDQTPTENAKTTHLAKEPTKMAEGGTVHKAEDRNKEPAKPKDIDMSHEKKLNSIYKAMGIKKYADGGDVDASQLPGGNVTPSPSDPTYWDQIKAALSKVGNSPAGQLAEMAANPVSGIANAVVGAAPGLMKAEAPIVSGVANTMTGGAIPAVSATPPAPAAAPVPPVMPPVAPKPMAAAPVGGNAPQGSELNNLFNQDTSKLTSGVNPEDRNALVNKIGEQQHGLGAVIAQAVAGLGDAFAAKGGKEQHSLQGIFSMQKEQRDEALANFDKARQDRIQKLALQTQMGNNSIQKLAAQDAYGTDEHLNKMLGAPPGTAHKDLPLYFQMKSAEVAQQEKDGDLYMKAHAQAANEVDAATKNASLLDFKPSAAKLEASGSKLADHYYNRAKGNILVKPSDGGQAQWIPAQNIGKAKQMDPNLTVQP